MAWTKTISAPACSAARIGCGAASSPIPPKPPSPATCKSWVNRSATRLAPWAALSTLPRTPRSIGPWTICPVCATNSPASADALQLLDLDRGSPLSEVSSKRTDGQPGQPGQAGGQQGQPGQGGQPGQAGGQRRRWTATGRSSRRPGRSSRQPPRRSGRQCNRWRRQSRWQPVWRLRHRQYSHLRSGSGAPTGTQPGRYPASRLTRD